MRPVPSGLTNTFGVHEPPWPAVRGIRRVTLLPAPAVTVNIDAGLLAGLMNAMQPQPVRAVAEPLEQQEIPR